MESNSRSCGNNNNNIEMWEWREEDFSLQRDPGLEIPHCIWDDINESDNNLLYMLGEHTPAKDHAEFGYGIIDAGGKFVYFDSFNPRLLPTLYDKGKLSPDKNNNNALEECRDSSQVKRRRMLQFTSDADDGAGMGDGQKLYAPESSKATEESFLGDELLECLEWDPEWSSSFSDDRCALSNDKLGQASEEGLSANCFNQSQMQHYSPGEMSSSMDDSVSSNDQVEVLDFRKIPPEMENVAVQKNPNQAFCRVFRGRKSYMKTPTKLTTTVVYPFTLIKPCGDQGDVTLEDINQRLHTPPPSKSKSKSNKAHHYPTSTITGKPVVVKTKIRTEGGKGSITIMRTKG